MTNLDSKTISMLRFPLIVGVVCIHARAVNPDLWGGIFQNLLGVEIGSISVPFSGIARHFKTRRLFEKMEKQMPFTFGSLPIVEFYSLHSLCCTKRLFIVRFLSCVLGY